MNITLKKALAGGLTIAAGVGVSVVPGASPGFAGPCERTVAIQPQVSAREGAGTVTFVVSSGGCAAPGQVTYTVTAGSAQAAGPAQAGDFQLTGGSLHWAAGDAGARLITARIVPDVVAEDDLEDFTVQLVAPSPRVRVDHATADVQILDDDGPGQPLSIVSNVLCYVDSPDPECHCPASGMLVIPYCEVPFLLSAPVGGPVTAYWHTADGTARAGVDFVGVPGQVITVPPDGTTAGLAVRVFPRRPEAPTLWFSVEISFVSSGRIVDAIAVVTIDGS